jgi:D-citramalate synthase
MAAVVAREFDVTLAPDTAREVLNNVTDFIGKGKEVSKGDLKLILEEVLDKVSLKDKVLEITDFDIRTTLKDQAEARITAVAYGETLTVSHAGVGPVDAAISALQKGLKEAHDKQIKLTDYAVAIDESGVDATVEVKMTLVDEKGNKVISRTTSPDIIVASIKAFEKGFNLLHIKQNGA